MRLKRQQKPSSVLKVGLDQGIYRLEAIHKAQEIYADYLQAKVTRLSGAYLLEISFLQEGDINLLRDEFLNHILGLSVQCQ